jgi:hypothetical protein
LDSEVRKFVHHAQRFGTEAVLDAAIEQDLNLKQLVELQTELDKIDAQPKKRFANGIKHRLSAEVRVRRQLGLEDEPEAA